MDFLVLIGRILFVAIFLGSGVNHLMNTQAMAGYARSKGVPAPWAATFGSGILQIVAGLMILLGIWADVGALLLVLFLIPTAVMMHNFWSEKDPAARQGDMLHFQKDIALAGAGLMLFGLFSRVGGDLDLMITGPLFNTH